MAVPSYKCFIEPLLRFLAQHDAIVSAEVARDAAAQALHLTPVDRQLLLRSGKLVYRDRAGWAFDRLKRAGLAEAPTPGLWILTQKGRDFAATTRRLTDLEVNKLAAAGSDSSSRAKDEVNSVAPGRLGPKGDRKAYRLEPRPIATGGQAAVFRAVRKADARTVIFKRVLGQSGSPRMQREIRVQTSLQHRHIMPILDWDPEKYHWYVMPLGVRDMSQLPRPIELSLLCSVLDSVLLALELAHSAGCPHRDIKPHNIIELANDGESRWVLADWGLTRRALGQTTSALTRTGHAIGTEGYAPPEAYTDAHLFGEAGDFYSLGQVIAWSTGVEPIPNVQPKVASPWDSLVEEMTRFDPSERLQSIADIRVRLLALQGYHEAHRRS